MENKSKMEIKVKEEVKEEPEEESIVKQLSILCVDESISIKQEPEIYIQDEFPIPEFFLEEVKIETQDQSESKTKNEPRKKPKQQCGVCSKILCSKQSLNYHMRTHEKRSYDSDQSSKSFETTPTIKAHEKSHQDEAKTSEVFECSICSKKFKQNWILRKHMITHREDRELISCDFCELKFKTKRGLEFHTLTLHTEVETKFACDHCPKTFNHKYLLKFHTRNHKMECCKICNKQMSKKSMTPHMRIVHGEHQNLQCPFCSKMMKNQNYLNQHIKMHEKNFECTFCDKRFARRNCLTEHLMSHENPSIFSCQPCNKAFQRKEYLLKHNQAFHKGTDGDTCGIKREKNFY